MKNEYLTLQEKEQILNQPYLSAKDLIKIMQTMSLTTARNHIKEIQQEMLDKGYYLPKSRTKLALTKLVRKRFGF